MADLFMMCEKLNRDAVSQLPEGYYFRNLRPDEFGAWKALQYSGVDEKYHPAYHKVLDEYWKDAYEPHGDLFFKKCVFVCDKDDNIVSTGMIWNSYGKFNSLSWFKTIDAHKGKGIGRALVSFIMDKLTDDDYPVFLHTHPGSIQAIKLYSDFGFCFITDKLVGKRNNDLEESLPELKQNMQAKDFENLKTCRAPQFFLDAADSTSESF